MNSVKISSQGRMLAAAEALAPIKTRIVALEAENGALHESLEYHVSEVQRQDAALNTLGDTLVAAYNRERALTAQLIEIIALAHDRNSAAVITLATAALRVIA